MELILILALFALGIVLIVKGGDLFVDAATWIAEASGIPKFIVGATVVSMATTLPEIIVSILAAAHGKVDMAIGNAVGSVTANTGLILGISILAIPAVIRRRHFGPKAAIMLAATASLLLVTRNGSLFLSGSIVLLALCALFIMENIQSARQDLGTERVNVPKDKKSVAIYLAKFVLGTAGIVLGARLLVDNGSGLARLFGVPEGIIGVTIIAIGTSLPELVTTLVALRKRQSAMSVGNIVGANIIDITIILPICMLFSGDSLPVAAQTIALDLPVCLLEAGLATIPTVILGRFHRWQGAVMMGVYIGYLAVLCLTGVLV